MAEDYKDLVTTIREMYRKPLINEAKGDVYSGKHPFTGGKISSTVTKKHRPLVWENMLATVHARSPQGKDKYFDYNWEEARKHANVEGHHDLRVMKSKGEYQEDPPRGKATLWGIPNEIKEEEINESMRDFVKESKSPVLGSMLNEYGFRHVGHVESEGNITHNFKRGKESLILRGKPGTGVYTYEHNHPTYGKSTFEHPEILEHHMDYLGRSDF